MDTIEYATFRYDTVEVENGLNGKVLTNHESNDVFWAQELSQCTFAHFIYFLVSDIHRINPRGC